MRRQRSKSSLALGLSVGLVLALMLAPQAHADSEAVFKRLLKSTGWINCPQPDGGNSWGTCWVVDRSQRLVITNKHVVDRATKVTVDFPLYERGQLLTKLSDYIPQTPYRGSVVYFDERRDLALCRLDEVPAEILALPLAAGTVPGNRVYSLGNSPANTPNQKDAKLWRFLGGKVEMRYFDVVTFAKAPVQRVEATSLRCSMKTAPGDSGGPVVNTH